MGPVTNVSLALTVFCCSPGVFHTTLLACRGYSEIPNCRTTLENVLEISELHKEKSWP